MMSASEKPQFYPCCLPYTPESNVYKAPEGSYHKRYICSPIPWIACFEGASWGTPPWSC